MITGWLEPLLQRVSENWTTVAMPSQMTIDRETFQLVTYDTRIPDLSGFEWTLHANWFPAPRREYQRRSNGTKSIQPFRLVLILSHPHLTFSN